MVLDSTPNSFRVLLDALRDTHEAHPALKDFCAFPDDLIPQSMIPVHRPCADIMAEHAPARGGPHAALCEAMLAAAPDAQWRDTYADTGIGQDFMQRFGCYCIIGAGGAWASRMMSAYLVFTPADFWYPWHQHPAEELYLVVAGEAEFLRAGQGAERLGPGGTMFHTSDEPHALRTGDQPVLALVMWRNHLGIKPVLTPSESISAPRSVQPA